jgi:hypothetical protein
LLAGLRLPGAFFVVRFAAIAAPVFARMRAYVTSLVTVQKKGGAG